MYSQYPDIPDISGIELINGSTSDLELILGEMNNRPWLYPTSKGQMYCLFTSSHFPGTFVMLQPNLSAFQTPMHHSLSESLRPKLSLPALLSHLPLHLRCSKVGEAVP